jgi:predicted amidophosphoribosyltransferase
MSWKRVRLHTSEHDGARFLNTDDDCYTYYEYVPGGAFDEYPGTQMMMNFKKPRNCSSYEKRYRQNAILELAKLLDRFLSARPVDRSLIIPIPSSKLPTNPEYTNRFEDLARAFRSINHTPILHAISIVEEIGNAHEDNLRDIDAIYGNLSFSRQSIPTETAIFYLLDDILTKGAHFKACERIVKDYFPAAKCIGVFFAQTTRE